MHTDNTYVISEPRLTCTGMWVALQDATIANGCMYGFPGSHKTTTDYFSILTEDKKATYYVGPKPYYENLYKASDATCLEVPKVNYEMK